MKKRINSKWVRILGASLLLSTVTVMTSYAGSWQKDGRGWWWQEDNGSYPTNAWCWLDGNQDGVSECYYFDGNGYMLANTTAPDGYQVNGDGAWTVDGVVQTKGRGYYTLEEASQMALNYHYALYPDADGTFVIFDEEAKVRNGCYEFIVRWQMSAQEAEKRIREGRDVAPNLYDGTVYVNIQTGKMWEEW